MSDIVSYFARFLLILPAIVLHEVSHGYVANLLGDPTAKRAGRLTLNPIKHIDPFGTILLPALLIFSTQGRAAFGYAKPVPVNPNYFRDYRKGFFLTALAGPATNVVLAAISGFAVRFVPPGWLQTVLFFFAQMNLVLVFFNLIPIPPLDGSRVWPLFLSDSAMRTYAQFEQYGFGILLLVLWVLPSVLGFDPIGWYLNKTVVPLLYFFVGA